MIRSPMHNLDFPNQRHLCYYSIYLSLYFPSDMAQTERRYLYVCNKNNMKLCIHVIKFWVEAAKLKQPVICFI